MFRQRLGDLSIEEGTPAVPADGRYYVIEAGVIRKSFKTLKGARTVYDALRAAHTPVSAAE